MSKKLKILILLSVLVPLGFYTKFYHGPASEIVRNYLGGLLYVIFWMLVAALIFPRTSSLKIALYVLIFTIIIEFSQLWHPAFLETLRHNFIGVTILGNYFAWYDFPWYVAGAIAGYFILKFISK